MAEAAQTVPTFKLVLVGDGGTGKVCIIDPLDAMLREAVAEILFSFMPGPVAHKEFRPKANDRVDYLRQASFDWRVREEVYCHTWC